MSEATLRRVVVSDVDGSTQDDEATLTVDSESPLATITDVWMTEGTGATDRAPEPPWELVPPPSGATWRIVEFKAGTAGPDLSRRMHSTSTVDLGIIVSG